MEIEDVTADDEKGWGREVRRKLGSGGVEAHRTR